jgi:hypothetical protein
MHAGFRLYGIERIKLSDYVIIDREKLPYLSPIEKFNCFYCSYINGSLLYMAEIAQRTEYYWCGIKHRHNPANKAFFYQEKFAKYGDPEDFTRVKVDSGHNK